MGFGLSVLLAVSVIAGLAIRRAPHPVSLPIGWGEGGRRPGEGIPAGIRRLF